MNCEDVRDLLDAWVDGELSAADGGAVGRHVEGCESCARDVARIRALGRRLQALGRHPLPDGLEGRIASIVDGAGQTHRSSGRWRLLLPRALTVLASHAIAVSVGVLAMVAWLWLRPGAPAAGSEREVVSAHVSGLVQEQFRSVESGNPHAVRPWFSGKIGFAPRVIDLAEAGFPLQAGRVDHLLGRPAAALVYARRSHRITLFIAPRSSMSRDVRVGGGEGYHLVGWGDAEFDYWAVSDLNRAELATFATMLRAAIDRTAR